jgi:hypothetical protein
MVTVPATKAAAHTIMVSNGVVQFIITLTATQLSLPQIQTADADHPTPSPLPISSPSAPPTATPSLPPSLQSNPPSEFQPSEDVQLFPFFIIVPVVNFALVGKLPSCPDKDNTKNENNV